CSRCRGGAGDARCRLARLRLSAPCCRARRELRPGSRRSDVRARPERQRQDDAPANPAGPFTASWGTDPFASRIPVFSFTGGNRAHRRLRSPGPPALLRLQRARHGADGPQRPPRHFFHAWHPRSRGGGARAGVAGNLAACRPAGHGNLGRRAPARPGRARARAGAAPAGDGRADGQPRLRQPGARAGAHRGARCRRHVDPLFHSRSRPCLPRRAARTAARRRSGSRAGGTARGDPGRHAATALPRRGAGGAARRRRAHLPARPEVIPFSQALRFWLKLGFISFGGPTGQIAIMHQELVERRRWISNGRFLHALNYCMLLPGPEAQQLAIYVGWLLHKVRGGIVAGVAFVLPAFFLILGLSYVYVTYGEVTWVAGIFYGLSAAVIGVVAAAVIRIGSTALRNPVMYGVAGAAFLAIFVFHVPFPLIVIAAGLIGFFAGPRWPGTFAIARGHADEAGTAI